MKLMAVIGIVLIIDLNANCTKEMLEEPAKGADTSGVVFRYDTNYTDTVIVITDDTTTNVIKE